MASTQYRSPLGIVRDILLTVMEVGKEGLTVSKLARDTNLSHDSAVAKCKELIEAGLIQSIRTHRNYIFWITEKGISFVHEIQKFQDSVKDLKVIY